MSEYGGLIALGVVGTFFAVLLIYYFKTMQRVETGEQFAHERGWQFQDVLPQLGHAQRQYIFRGRSADKGIEWEMVINLKQSTTQTIPIASTVWSTDQIRSSNGIVLVGPKLDKFFDTLDLSNPMVTMFFRMILGDEADRIGDLKRVTIEGTSNLTVLATDSEYGKKIITSEVLDWYQDWIKRYKGEERFPVLFLSNDRFQFKVKRTLTRAAEADAFVNFCLGVASSVRMST
jgi:hypothetical protein